MASRILTASVTLGVLIAAVAGTVGALSFMKHQSPVEVITQQLVPSPQHVFGKDHLLVLVVGLDYDYDPKDNETSKTSRSDIIKAIDLDFATHRVYVLSIPRDMDAILPSGQEAKINQAQSEGGIGESQTVVAKWLGIPGFDRYVVLRIDTVKDLIDALGGVDVDVMNSDALKGQGPNGPVDYDDNWGHLHVHLKPGLQRLDGGHAVGYARFRHDWCSDPCRIMRQDQVVKALIARFKGDKLNTLAHMDLLLAAVHHDIETSLTPGEELSIATAFASLDPHGVQTAQVPYVDDKSIPIYGNVIVPDVAARAHLVQTMLLAPPRPSTAAATATALVPSAVRVDVRNGTATAGLAQRVAGILKSKGFVVASVGNAATPNVSLTELRSASSAAAASVRNALGPTLSTAAIVADGTAGVTLTLGQDFVDATAASQALSPQ